MASGRRPDVVDEEAKRRYLRNPETRALGAAAVANVTWTRKTGQEPAPDIVALAEEYMAMTGYPSVNREPVRRATLLGRLLHRLAG